MAGLAVGVAVDGEVDGVDVDGVTGVELASGDAACGTVSDWVISQMSDTVSTSVSKEEISSNTTSSPELCCWLTSAGCTS